MNNEMLINNVKTLCNDRGITVTKLEEVLGISQGLISRWSKSAPSLQRVIDIADYFKVSLDELVGRNDIVNDEFLRVLIDRTENKTIIWNTFTNNMEYHVIKPSRINEATLRGSYDEDIFTELSYYSMFNGGFIITHCFCKHNNSTNPEELELYIQPSEVDDLIMQKYTKEQLTPLWIKVLRNLSSDIPSDVLAEDFKQQLIAGEDFIYLDKVKGLLDNTIAEPHEIDKLLNDENAKKILTEANNPAVQQIISIFSDEKTAKAIEAANRMVNYFQLISDKRNDK